MNKVKLTFILSLSISISSFAFQVDSFNLKVGDTYQITVNQSQEITQSVRGMANNVNTENESLEFIQVEEITPSGDYILSLTILEQKTVVISPMMTIVEDTENANLGSGLYPALKYTSYNFQMTNKGEIVSIDGLEEVKDILRAKLRRNRQAQAQIELLYNEETIRSTLEQRFSYFPKSNQMRWTVDQTVDMNSMPVSMGTNYSYSNNYTIQADGVLSADSSVDLFGTTTQVELIGTMNTTFNLNQLSGMPNTITSRNNITGSAFAMGMSIPMTIKTDTKTTFTKQN